MNEVISSRHNQSIVRICKLSDRKWRESERLFRFDGVKLCAESILSGLELDCVLLRRSSAEDVSERIKNITQRSLEASASRILLLEDSVFDSVSEEKSPEGVISVAKYIDKIHKIATIDNKLTDMLPRGARLILLENIQDPGNLGTIMRTSAALGIDMVILCGDCADVYNSKTLRGSMGAVFRLPTLRVRDGVEAVSALRAASYRVLAAALTDDAVDIGELSLSRGDCIAIGNEGHGLSRGLIDSSDMLVIIPMADGNESLNAASAATVFIWELCKDRH